MTKLYSPRDPRFELEVMRWGGWQASHDVGVLDSIERAESGSYLVKFVCGCMGTKMGAHWVAWTHCPWHANGRHRADRVA